MFKLQEEHIHYYTMDFQERVIYNKEVQTAFEESETNLQDIEEEIRQRILREKEQEAERVARDKELEEESVKLDQEIEQEIRGESPMVSYKPLSYQLQNIQSFPRKSVPAYSQHRSFWIL